jgi:hypothetical protein
MGESTNNSIMRSKGLSPKRESEFLNEVIIKQQKLFISMVRR